MKKINYIFYLLVMFSLFSCAEEGDITGGNAAISGSYAKMLSRGEYLYFANQSELVTFSISERANPVELDRQSLNFGLESVFIREDLMFIGSTTQMYIYRLTSTGIPEFLSTTSYQNWGSAGCWADPIVTNDTLAFVTIATNDLPAIGCQRNEVNELRLFDITNLEAPVLKNIVEMEEPKGLGLDGTWLFVCERNDGLKVFDVSRLTDVKQIHHFDNYQSFDVIPLNGLLLVVGPDKLYQYDYSDMENMYLLSTIDL